MLDTPAPAQSMSSSPYAVEAYGLQRFFYRRERGQGLKEAVKSFFVPQWIEKKAIVNLDLRIRKNKVVGLVGANGAGKTTLLKMIAGLVHPTHGEIQVLGFKPFERQPVFLKKIGMVMGQKSQLWVDIPAIDSFELLASIYEISKEEFQSRIYELSQIFKAQDILKTQVRRLSLGERMKLEIIAALLHKPELVILDEPTIGLDLLAKEAIRELILTLNQQQKTSILLSSHDMEDISELCEDLIVIAHGKKVFDGELNTFSKDKRLKNHVLEILRSDPAPESKS